MWWLISAAWAAKFPSAPDLAASNWLMGEPVSIPAEGTVVVELWATWCGPCLEQLPHLNALAQTYDGQVSIAAISDEKPSQIKRFWSRAGWTPRYAIGTDPSGATSRRFQRIDGSGSIPRAFIVDDGEVVWSGHPAAMDGILAAVVTDRWSAERAEKLSTLPEAAARYMRAISEAQPQAAAAPRADLLGYGDLAPDLLNQIAWWMLTEAPTAQRDLSFSVEASAIAVRIHPDSAAYLDTHALALFESDRISEAVTMQQRAVDRCPQGDASCAELQDRLMRFRSALP